MFISFEAWELVLLADFSEVGFYIGEHRKRSTNHNNTIGFQDLNQKFFIFTDEVGYPLRLFTSRISNGEAMQVSFLDEAFCRFFYLLIICISKSKAALEMFLYTWMLLTHHSEERRSTCTIGNHHYIACVFWEVEGKVLYHFCFYGLPQW